MEKIWLCTSSCWQRHIHPIPLGLYGGIQHIHTCWVLWLAINRISVLDSWNNLCFNNNWTNFSQPISNVKHRETKVCCRHYCRTLYRLNVHHLQFALCTIFKGLCRGACSSSMTYQCVLHISYWSCADKCAMRSAHDIIGSFWWDNDHLGCIPSFPVRLLTTFRKIVGGLLQRRYVVDIHGSHQRGYHNLFRLLTQGSLTSSSAVHATEPTG
jgi:hypothetical protein